MFWVGRLDRDSNEFVGRFWLNFFYYWVLVFIFEMSVGLMILWGFFVLILYKFMDFFN